MSWPAATVSRMKSKLPACFCVSSALQGTTTSSAPRRSASSFLLGEGVKATLHARLFALYQDYKQAFREGKAERRFRRACRMRRRFGGSPFHISPRRRNATSNRIVPCWTSCAASSPKNCTIFSCGSRRAAASVKFPLLSSPTNC